MSNETEIIKERIDLAELVSEYVQLKKMGRHWKARCPFHDEKTPSFVVSPDKGIWHCFGCGRGGDAFSFLQEKEGMSFPEALQFLAERTGVEIKKVSRHEQSRRTRLFELLALAARFYHELLVNQKVGTKAREYLAERGVKSDTLTAFDVGYAPHAWDTVQQYLRKKGYSHDEMVAAGLVGRSERGKLYDRFRGRIMFPIHDVQGRVMGFGGRICPWHATGEEGKYVNSPETAIYEKRRIVYNLQRAKHALREGTPCVVVEGYMDVLLLSQVGVENVVASSGTAFTAEQIVQISRYTTIVHFAFDADAAGQSAAQAATETAVTAGLRVAQLVLPAGSDPADLAQEDPKQLQDILAHPQSLLSVLLARLKEAEGVDRERVLEDVLPVLARVTNPVVLGELVAEVATTLHVAESVVVDALSRQPRQAAAKPVEAELAQEEVVFPLDRQVVGLALAEPSARVQLFDSIQPHQLEDAPVRGVFEELAEMRSARKAFGTESAADLVAVLSEERQSLASGLVGVVQERLQELGHPVSVETRQLIRAVLERSVRSELATLQDELAHAEGAARDKVLEKARALTETLSSVTVE